MTSNEWSLQKKIIVAVLVIAGAFAAVAGIVYGVSHSNQEDVLVIPVYDADYGSEDDETGTIEGTISTGTTQTITYDSNRKILEIKVQEGDHVKKGDTLVVYDASQSSDTIEQRTLDVKSVELSIKQLQRKIDNLNSATQMIVPDDVDSDDDDKDDEEYDDELDPALKSKKSKKEDKDDEEFEGESGNAAADAGSDELSDDEDFEDEEEADDGIDLSDYDPGETVYVDSEGEVYSEADMRKEKLSAENEMRSLNTDLAEANEDLAQAQAELAGNDAVASFDGVVTSVSMSVSDQPQAEDVSDAGADPASEGFVQMNSMDGLPVLTVSSFDGIYVNTAVSEWQYPTISEGDYIYVTDWTTDEIYPAKITQISKYASDSMTSMYSDDEGNNAYYPITALIEEDGTGLSAGDSVDVSFTKPSDYEGDEEEDYDEEDEPIYLYKAFVVSEGNDLFVYKADEEGKLKKQKLTVSGQERETYIVTGGITEDDYIAFPFGDNIKEGANTVQGEMDQLYEDY